jgi:hypothetical protein
VFDIARGEYRIPTQTILVSPGEGIYEYEEEKHQC